MPFRRRNSWLSQFITPPVVIAGLVLWLVYASILVLQAQSWKQTTGTVAGAGFVRGHYDRSLHRRTHNYRVDYEYSVKDSTYANDKIWRGYGEIAGDFIPARTEYTPGQEVVVYYDPANPSESALSRGYSPGELIAVIALPLVILWHRRRRSSSSRKALLEA